MHDEALTKSATLLLPKFKSFKEFYLVGGTALALHIGHRQSVDFDFFTKKPLDPKLLSKTKRVFKGASIAVTYRSPDQLNLLIDNVQTTFLQYEYPLIKSFAKHRGISLLSILEIAAMKAFSIGKRLSYKDYVDWYFLLKEEHITLKQAIHCAQKKFGGDFNDRLFLGQLISLQEVPTQEIYFLRNEVPRETIQDFLTTAVRQYKI